VCLQTPIIIYYLRKGNDMPRVAKTTKTTKTTSKKIEVSLHLPGKMPENVKLAAGSTLGDVIADMNLDGYDISLNGSKASNKTVLTKGDIVRVGVHTKNR
jgi:hypothetical protein